MLARDYLSNLISSLERQGVVMPRLVSESILSHVLGIDRHMIEHYDELNFDEKTRAENLIQRVISGEPYEYVLGKVEFYGLDLLLSKKALIPRPETELMLDFAIKQVSEKMMAGVMVDVCCGTGCLGLGFKKAMPEFEVNLCDIDESCVELAKDNALKNELEVRVLQGDFLEPLKALGADVLITNPPYISEEEFEELDPSVKDYEPKKALVAKEDGLYFYRKMAEELHLYLNPGAMVFVEIGANQGEAVRELFEKSPLRVVNLQKDLAGHDRFFYLEYEKRE